MVYRRKRIRVVDIWADFPNGKAASAVVTDPTSGIGDSSGLSGNLKVLIPPSEVDPTPLVVPNDVNYYPNLNFKDRPAVVESLPYSRLNLVPNILRDIPLPLPLTWSHYDTLNYSAYDNLAGSLMFTDGKDNALDGDYKGNYNNDFQVPANPSRSCLSYVLPSKYNVDTIKLWFTTRNRNTARNWRPSVMTAYTNLAGLPATGQVAMAGGVTVKLYDGSNKLVGTISQYPHTSQYSYYAAEEILLFKFMFEPVKRVKRIDFHFRRYTYGLAEVEAFGEPFDGSQPDPDPLGLKWTAGFVPTPVLQDNYLRGRLGVPVDTDNGDSGVGDIALLTNGVLSDTFMVISTGKLHDTYYTLRNPQTVYRFNIWGHHVSDVPPENCSIGCLLELYDSDEQLVFSNQGATDSITPGFNRLSLSHEDGLPLANDVKFVKIRWLEFYSSRIGEVELL